MPVWRQPSGGINDLARFVIIFSVVLVGLFSFEMLETVQEHVILPFTTHIADVSAALIKPFDASVSSHGKVIADKTSGFAVSIEAGCNGVEAGIVLTAAILAFPASWKSRVVGLLVGFLSIQALNILRIISLFYLGQWTEAVFMWTHLYLWPVLIMLDVLVVFLLYVRYVVHPKKAPKPV